jgi:hypothetical protein
VSARRPASRRAPAATKSAAPELPLAEALVKAVAENQLRRYGSEYISDHLTWQDFADTAREDVSTTLRTLASVKLELQASALDEQAEAFGLPKMGTPASGMVTVLSELAEELRGRAAELWGD